MNWYTPALYRPARITSGSTEIGSGEAEDIPGIKVVGTGPDRVEPGWVDPGTMATGDIIGTAGIGGRES